MASTTGFRMSVPENAAFPGAPSVECDCGRITVLLGANGTGKSGILRHLRGPLPGPKEQREIVLRQAPVLWPGEDVSTSRAGASSRRWLGDPILQCSNAHPSLGKPSHPRRRSNMRAHSLISCKSGSNWCFTFLAAQADPHKREYFDAIRQWEVAGRNGQQPAREDTLMDRVFDRFHQVFPDIVLSCDSKSFEVLCRKGSETYRVADLSDGEKQVLAMLADLTSCAPSDAAFIVDEPELNLHPLLACRVWDVIEADRPGGSLSMELTAFRSRCAVASKPESSLAAGARPPNLCWRLAAWIGGRRKSSWGRFPRLRSLERLLRWRERRIHSTENSISGFLATSTRLYPWGLATVLSPPQKV